MTRIFARASIFIALVLWVFTGSALASAVTSASPPGGTYLGAQDVLLSTNEPATVYCTTDGTMPQMSPAFVCSSKIRVAADTVLTFFSVNGLGDIEQTKTASYMITGGELVVWGNNSSGQLGDWTTLSRRTPSNLNGLGEIVTMSAGFTHSAAVKKDGTSWTWGANYDGQLGDGTTTQRLTPVQVNGLSDVISISAANRHTVAVKRDGTVWAWGRNDYGQLGNGTTTGSPLPVQVSGLADAVAVATGEYHSVALKKDGTVWAWGQNAYGELGDGTSYNRVEPVQVSGLTDVISVSTGYAHTLAVKKDGTVWAWGNNSYAQLGDGTYLFKRVPVQVFSGVDAVSAGHFFSTAFKQDGTVWAWGRNNFGQLGDGTTETRPTPVQVSAMTQAAAISSGGYYTLATKQGGTIWAWGTNGSGQFGNGTQNGSSVPIDTSISGAGMISSGYSHVLALYESDTVAIIMSSLAPGVINSYYNQTLAASGGTRPYTWSIDSGSLPTGLSLSVSGVISGTPVSAGTTTLTVRVTDAEYSTTTKSVSINITNPPVFISTSSLSSGNPGIPYSQTLVATGGVTPYSWSVISGSLPAGLSLASTGVISGTPVTVETRSFTVQVTDALSSTATKSLSIAITNGPLSITTSSLASGLTGLYYSQTLAATGGATPYSWSMYGGTSLPAGLSLSSNGVISGTPLSAGTTSFTVAVTDVNSWIATKQLSITVSVGPLAITTTSLASGVTGSFYSQTLVASGGYPPYYWSTMMGSLPAGLSLNHSTGVISGTPTSAGIYNFTAIVTDASSSEARKSLSIVIMGNEPLTVTTSFLASGVTTTHYYETLAASGGTPSYTWSLASGSMPAGLTLDSTGVISGMPMSAGTTTFTVQATDAVSSTATKLLSITINEVSFAITATAGPNGSISPSGTVSVLAGTDQTFYITPDPGYIPVDVVVDGVSMGPIPQYTFYGVYADHTISATFRAYTITPTAGPNGSISPSGTVSVLAGADQTFYITPDPGYIPVDVVVDGVSMGPIPQYTFYSVYADHIISVNFAEDNFTIAASADAGGVISPSGSVVVNRGGSQAFFITPDAGYHVADVLVDGVFVGAVTSYTFSSVAANHAISASFAVNEPLTITTESLPNGAKGKPYSQTLAAAGGIPPYTWQISPISLPPGLSLNGDTGEISGTPTRVGTFTFDVWVLDTVTGGPVKTLSITIKGK